MTYFKKPDVNQNIIVLNKDRYCLVEIKDSHGFFDFTSEFADYVLFDKKRCTAVALIKNTSNGKYEFEVLCLYSDKEIYDDLDSLMKDAPRMVYSAEKLFTGRG